MRPNFEVRPRAVTHLALAQDRPCVAVTDSNIELETGARKILYKLIIKHFSFSLW